MTGEAASPPVRRPRPKGIIPMHWLFPVTVTALAALSLVVPVFRDSFYSQMSFDPATGANLTVETVDYTLLHSFPPASSAGVFQILSWCLTPALLGSALLAWFLWWAGRRLDPYHPALLDLLFPIIAIPPLFAVGMTANALIIHFSIARLFPGNQVTLPSGPLYGLWIALGVIILNPIAYYPWAVCFMRKLWDRSGIYSHPMDDYWRRAARSLTTLVCGVARNPLWGPPIFCFLLFAGLWPWVPAPSATVRLVSGLLVAVGCRLMVPSIPFQRLSARPAIGAYGLALLLTLSVAACFRFSFTP